jgi:predicted TIM-barrel fold metal-dependent hydrolase
LDLPCLPPVARPKKPTIPLPAGACDAHFHIFGPPEKFPYAEGRAYTPPAAPLEAVLAMHAALGISHGVAIQGNAHGTDNTAMLDAISREPKRLRGVAIVPPTVTDAELKRMAGLGVKALRFHHMAGPIKATFSALGIPAFLELAPRMADLGLHLQLMMDADELEVVMPRIKAWKLPVVIDHMGSTHAAAGTSAPGYQALRKYLAEGKIWVKLSGTYRASKQYPDYADARPLHEGLLQANPDQVLWGTDWPHPRLGADMPDDGHLVDLLQAWTPDAALRKKILVDNPARLYGFGE